MLFAHAFNSNALKSNAPTSGVSNWKIALGTAAIMVLSMAPASLAQNQSDVTGPNLSDVSGTNQSDVSGSNQSDNTAVLGIQIPSDVDGTSVPITAAFRDFFLQYGDELGLDSQANLLENFAQARAACNPQPEGDRRFALNPRPAPVSPACTQFSELVQSVRDAVAEYRGNDRSNTGRPW